MTEQFAEPSPLDNEIERINEIGVQTASEVMRFVCSRLILMSHDAIEYHLQKDADKLAEIEDNDRISNRIINLFVLHDSFTAPKIDNEFIDTLSIKVGPNKEDARYMKLHIPLGGLSVHEFRTPPEQDIEQMYVEDSNGDVSRWYMINRTGLSRYAPIGQDNMELTDEEMWSWIQERIPEKGAIIIEKLMHQAVNWQTMPQRNVRL